MIARAGSALALLALVGCVADGGGETAPANTTVVQPVVEPKPAPVPSPTESKMLSFDGQLTQGGWIRGKLGPGDWMAQLGRQAVQVAPDGSFFAAFDRDSPSQIVFKAVSGDLIYVTQALSISPREWQIERVNVDRAPGGATETFMALRRPELARIEVARARNSASNGWRQSMIWPVEGRISGRFGSQRIYRGEPAAYHSGLDIAPGAGVPYVAPADGVVTLAAESPFTLEGNLLIIDHGMGLNSAFLHSSRLAVKEGDVVKQGQLLGYVGATGRATGPHLHWSIKWRDSRLDPLLFLPPR